MLKVYVKKLGTSVILNLEGRIVIGETDALRAAVGMQRNITELVLDLKGVNMIDAAGFGVLLELREQLKVREIKLKLTDPTERVSEVLELTRLNTVFEITSEERVLATETVKTSDLVACA